MNKTRFSQIILDFYERHHGYLVHHILEHAELPWQLLPFIKEIEINLRFNDFEAAWERAGNCPPS